ncbi:tyrosine-type recombinase/integrase [Streptosporangium sp. NPDC000563]|uniref:tyrosine-type recombinase/integrase n=1 Tax=Streptosporangium sp. NPDC000563 TaxID=3154366 RepID=UPI00331B0F72
MASHHRAAPGRDRHRHRPRRTHPHIARATAALDAGVPLADVQEFLGHASSATTQRYNRGRRKLDSHAAYRMAAILAGDA